MDRLTQTNNVLNRPNESKHIDSGKSSQIIMRKVGWYFNVILTSASLWPRVGYHYAKTPTSMRPVLASHVIGDKIVANHSIE